MTISWQVITLRALPEYRLELVFADETAGIVELSKDEFTGVLAPLADSAFFAQAAVLDGVVVWPNGLDLAPDALYDEIAAQKGGAA